MLSLTSSELRRLEGSCTTQPYRLLPLLPSYSLRLVRDGIKVQSLDSPSMSREDPPQAHGLGHSFLTSLLFPKIVVILKKKKNLHHKPRRQVSKGRNISIQPNE